MRTITTLEELEQEPVRIPAWDWRTDRDPEVMYIGDEHQDLARSKGIPVRGTRA